MSTISQLCRRHRRITKRIRPLVPALCCCPQKRGVVQKIFIQTPKKPNSAKRKVAKVKLSTGRIISCYIPGIGHKLTKHSVVLVRGGRAQDLIGVRYKPIFGKFDFVPPANRVTRLSKYGLSNKKNRQVNAADAELETTIKKVPGSSIHTVSITHKRTLRYPKQYRKYINTNISFDISLYLNART